MKSLNLTNLTPSERVARLNEAVAVELGHKFTTRFIENGGPTGLFGDHSKFFVGEEGKITYLSDLKYAESADAILPLLKGTRWGADELEDGRVCVLVENPASLTRYFQHTAETFPEAAAIALLRAKGWEVVT